MYEKYAFAELNNYEIIYNLAVISEHFKILVLIQRYL